VHQAKFYIISLNSKNKKKGPKILRSLNTLNVWSLAYLPYTTKKKELERLLNVKKAWVNKFFYHVFFSHPSTT
jgi:hypothetical protein